MKRKKLIVALLCILGFLAATGLRRAFGAADQATITVTINKEPGTPLYKVEWTEKKQAPANTPKPKP